MSDHTPKDPVSMSEAVGDFPQPERTMDLDAFGVEYVRKARITAAVARWSDACPPDLAETDWNDPRIVANAAEHQKIKGWKYQRMGILATGPSGLGKSRSMWALMKSLAEEGRDIRYYSAAQWFSNLDNQIKYGRDDAMGWVTAVAKAPIVFIDDYGQEAVQANKQEWAASWFFQFLDLRLGQALPLFITTNLDAKQMAGGATAVRSNPLIRRILELCDPVKFNQAPP
jgi:DNA replication protein DnaC